MTILNANASLSLMRKQGVLNDGLEEFGLFFEDFTKQEVSQSTCSHAEPLISEPFFA